MAKFITSAAIGLAALLSSGGALASAQTPGGDVQALAGRIRATIAAQPSTSQVAAYQAQIASALESDGYTCEVIRQALSLSYVSAPDEAQKALARLRNSFAGCRVGTGAIGNGGGVRFSGVGFSVGGGSSNYTN